LHDLLVVVGEQVVEVAELHVALLQTHTGRAVSVQMWQRVSPSPGADVVGAGPVPVQMRQR
jgi:hypothetical protein